MIPPVFLPGLMPVLPYFQMKTSLSLPSFSS